MIEIGPGRGALTEFLLARADRVVAIEVDTVLVHYLRHKFSGEIASGKLDIVEGDILQVDLSALGLHPVIAGNLPYYITSPILEKTFSLGSGWVRAVFLVQAEVAERITASPGTRDFGYLSVMAQTQAAAELMFPVSRTVFHPPPNVDSAVVRLTPRDGARELGVTDLTGFLKFAQACFRQKRKTLRNNLAPIYGDGNIANLPEARLRAEQLSVSELAALYRKVAGA